MSAGGPVRKRSSGFANDIQALNRLRTALKIDRNLDRSQVAKAVISLDQLIDSLGELHHDIADRRAS